MSSEPTSVGVPVAPEAVAVQALYERHAPRVYRFCLGQLGAREEAEDATQSTFLNAFRALRRGVVPVAESPWLLSIAQNVCLTRLRSSIRRRRVEAPRDLHALQDEISAPVRERVDELLRLEDALSELPPSQRRAILLREWQGLSYREIAAELETTQAAVETLIFRARRTLAERLEEPPRRGRLARWIDFASGAAWLQGLLAGGTAKAVATATAVTTVALAGGVPLRHDEPPKADAAPARPAASPVAKVASEVREPAVVRLAAADRATSRRTPPVARKAAPPRRGPKLRPTEVTPVAVPKDKPTPQAAAAAVRRVERAEEQQARRTAREERKAARVAERAAVVRERPAPALANAGEKKVKEEKEPNGRGPDAPLDSPAG
jgi:RNA polymerase sigma factor (sigma-70 family)